MPKVYPDFYPRFRCRAERCRHSCCRGWEIDVDAESAAYYRALPGPLGDALRAALTEDDEGFHFSLDAEERCPFLRRDGLCRLICELGVDALCDICALHPRFFGNCGSYELAGLGLSCEAAAALLLETDAPLCFTAGEEIFELDGLLARLSLFCPAEDLRFAPRPDPVRYRRLLEALAETEPIDELWTAELAALLRGLDDVLAAARDYVPHYDRSRFDRIFAYILYRQLERLDSVPLPALLAFARDSTEFVFLCAARSGDPAEALRRWSEQIEYSTENVELLLGL